MSTSVFVNGFSRLAIVILVKDEELHLRRCLQSVSRLTDYYVVVDSGSRDKSLDIAKSFNACIFFKKWVNYSDQFEYALRCVSKDCDWILRLDADEVVTPELEMQIQCVMSLAGAENAQGFTVQRSFVFQGKKIRYGGVSRVPTLRLFRNGFGQIEKRWMDEHILVEGEVKSLSGEIIDNNLKPFSWWLDKHNWYSSREAIDILSCRYDLDLDKGRATLSMGFAANIKRVLKQKVYMRFPLGSRALLYFCFRWFVMLGFLDGPVGFRFHFLQGFVYRYVVDLKVLEVESHMKRHSLDLRSSIKAVLSFTV